MSQTRTVVELDMVGYGNIARELEKKYGDPIVVAELNKEIQQFVDFGLNEVNLAPEDVVKARNGDNAVIVFKDPIKAHKFAETVHLCTKEYNDKQQGLLAQRWFRIGCATDPLYEEEFIIDNKIHGNVISTAYRLEAAAKPGEFLIDAATYDALKEFLENDPYSAPETVPGKKDEEFHDVRRWQVIPRVSLLELMPKHSELKNAVDEYFSNLGETYKIIGKSYNYKILHDQFQNLENEINPLSSLEKSLDSNTMGIIIEEISNRNNDNSNLNKSLKEIETILDKENQKLEIHELRIKEWKETISNIKENLETAAQNTKRENYREPLLNIIEDISTLIYNQGMFLLNKLLVQSVRQLGLTDLIENLDKIINVYKEKCKIFDEKQLDHIESNIKAINLIKDKLTNLLDIHDRLQFFDEKLRYIKEELDNPGNRSIKKILEKWDSHYPDIKTLFEEQNLPDDVQAKSILELATALNKKRLKENITPDNKGEFHLQFIPFITKVNQYFNKVDDDLNKLIERELKETFKTLQERDAVLDISQIQSL